MPHHARRSRPLIEGLASPSDSLRILALLQRLHAPSALQSQAEAVLPGRTVIAWTPHPSRLLAVALVAMSDDTATLLYLGATACGPSLRDLAAWVPGWCQPARGVRILRAAADIPRDILSGRWRPAAGGYRYRFRPGDRATRCSLCGARRISQREALEHPGLLCPQCDARAVDYRGHPPPILDDHESTRVFVDGVPCVRYHLFGGWVTQRVRPHRATST